MATQSFRSLLYLIVSLPSLALVLGSCATGEMVTDGSYVPAQLPSAAQKKAFASNHERSGKDDGRMRIYQASQTIEVTDVASSVQQAEDQVRARNGIVESSSTSSNGESYTSLTLRVPADEWRSALDEFAALGKETSRRTTAEDTTVAYIDLKARLKNTEALRDRLRRLLDATNSVKEILEIEKELARVQTDLDAMKAKFQLMQSQVRMAKIDLTLTTKEIPGPVGAAGKGIWWSIRKLFVLK